MSIELFVVGKCPFGIVTESNLILALEKLGDYVDFRLDFIDDREKKYREEGKKGAIIQLCARKYSFDKYLKFILCMNKDYKNFPYNWEDCASEFGLDIAEIRTCYEGSEGEKFYLDSLARSEKRDVKHSPTLFVNGQKDAETGLQTDEFLKRLCHKFKEKPEGCKNIPELQEVRLIVINDKRCKDCFPQRIIDKFKKAFPKLIVREFDYNSEEGRRFYQLLGIKLLPAYIFGRNITEEPGYNNYQRFFRDVDGYKLLTIGGKFDPTMQ
ncbi:MAG: hypothetical protein AB1465_05025 [Patescibacteria group bacterium]